MIKHDFKKYTHKSFLSLKHGNQDVSPKQCLWGMQQITKSILGTALLHLGSLKHPEEMWQINTHHHSSAGVVYTISRSLGPLKTLIVNRIA